MESRSTGGGPSVARADRCPFVHRNQLSLCQAHHSVTFEPADGKGRTLSPALTCSFLTVGASPGRFYPRCALGDEAARQAEAARRRTELYLRVSQALHSPGGPGELQQAGVMMAGDDGRYIAVNKTMCTWLGFEREEVVSKSVWDLTPPPHDPNGRAMWRDFITAGEGFGTYHLMTSDGRVITFDYIARANVSPGVHMSILTPSGGKSEIRARHVRQPS